MHDSMLQLYRCSSCFAFSDHNRLSSINEHTQSKVVNYTPPAKVIWMFIKWPFSIVLDVCQVQLLINDYDL